MVSWLVFLAQICVMCLLVFTAIDAALMYFWNIDSSSKVWASGGLSSPCDLPNDPAKLCCFLSWEINAFTSHKIRASQILLVSLQHLSQPMTAPNKANPTFCVVLPTNFLVISGLLKCSSLKCNLVLSNNFPLCLSCLCQGPKRMFFPFWNTTRILVVENSDVASSKWSELCNSPLLNGSGTVSGSLFCLSAVELKTRPLLKVHRPVFTNFSLRHSGGGSFSSQWSVSCSRISLWRWCVLPFQQSCLTALPLSQI